MERKIVLWAFAITIPVVIAVTALLLRHEQATTLSAPTTVQRGAPTAPTSGRGYTPATSATTAPPATPATPAATGSPEPSSPPTRPVSPPAGAVTSLAPVPAVPSATAPPTAAATSEPPAVSGPAVTAAPVTAVSSVPAAVVPPTIAIPSSVAMTPITLSTTETDPPSNPGSGSGYFTDGIDATECAAHQATISFTTPASHGVTRQVNATGWMTISTPEAGGAPSGHGWTFSWGFRSNGTCFTTVNEF